MTGGANVGRVSESVGNQSSLVGYDEQVLDWNVEWLELASPDYGGSSEEFCGHHQISSIAAAVATG